MGVHVRSDEDVLWVEVRGEHRAICVQTDERRVRHFELSDVERRALIASLSLPERGCAHPLCYDESGHWDGCQEPSRAQLDEWDNAR
jgi:hypothetical protein